VWNEHRSLESAVCVRMQESQFKFILCRISPTILRCRCIHSGSFIHSAMYRSRQSKRYVEESSGQGNPYYTDAQSTLLVLSLCQLLFSMTMTTQKSKSQETNILSPLIQPFVDPSVKSPTLRSGAHTRENSTKRSENIAPPT